ncbi:Hypothetical predicted protein [Paramuricea clavata]|uniref:Uncharacterized protein n=1 Tax=Paramuricea clavata TaxID=317549 RepID=A0A6S7IPG2_PARCT|nr:Hypothetical predicted protein [Paramuricea clavata]
MAESFVINCNHLTNCDVDATIKRQSNEYFNTEMDRIEDIKQNVNEWNERLMLVLDMHDVRQEDSVSNYVGLRQRSHARNISQRSKGGSNTSGYSNKTPRNFKKSVHPIAAQWKGQSARSSCWKQRSEQRRQDEYKITFTH